MLAEMPRGGRMTYRQLTTAVRWREEGEEGNRGTEKTENMMSCGNGRKGGEGRDGLREWPVSTLMCDIYGADQTIG